MAEKQEPKGFKCVCGEWHKFGVYVFAHWTDSLTHTCQSCGAKHDVHKGRITLISKGTPSGKRKV